MDKNTRTKPNHLQKAKKEKQEIANQIWKLQQEKKLLSENIEKMFWEELSHAAKSKDIAINREYAESLMRDSADPQQLHELGLYVKACKAFTELQRSFSAFYESKTFADLCERIANGDYPRVNYCPRPRLADSTYRVRNWDGQENHNQFAKDNL